MDKKHKKKLSVHFHGICTHFRGIVAGVPHRVVLPDAMMIQGGTIDVGNEPPQAYVFHPHMPFLAPEEGATLDVNVPGYIAGGFIIGGVRLQIVNAVHDSVTYPDNAFDNQIPSLTQFVRNYRPSNEVVYGGRAKCYFDVFSGEVKTRDKGSAHHTVIDIHTHGHPVLQVTPLIGDPEASTAPAWHFELRTKVLKVANFCTSSDEFDFLLNYLTAEGGIPRAVSQGFPLELPSSPPGGSDMAVMRPEGLNAALMAELVRHVVADEGTSAACSDSRYP